MEEHVSLFEVGRRVRSEIAAFVISAGMPDQLGTPLPEEWFLQQLGEMKAALVAPYFAVIEGDGQLTGAVPKVLPRRIVIVAEDEDTFLVYDPDPEGNFALIFKSATGISPVRGSAVDCFMSR